MGHGSAWKGQAAVERVKAVLSKQVAALQEDDRGAGNGSRYVKIASPQMEWDYQDYHGNG